MEKLWNRLGITELNDLQQASIAANDDRDLLIQAHTGSGKTLAFLLPICEKLKQGGEGIQVMIVVPMRELAIQIEQVFKQMNTGFRVTCCYGGHTNQVEKNNLKENPHVLIGTPGRLTQHIKENVINTATIHTLVLDEFDKSLEYGFLKDMEAIVASLTMLQRRILTSATKMTEIPAFVGANKPIYIDFLGDHSAAPQLTYKQIACSEGDKMYKLLHLLCYMNGQLGIVFCNHKEAVTKVSKWLNNKGYPHSLFHGDMEQESRELALLQFKNGTHHLLIATDLAARGIDVSDVAYIVHYQLPVTKESFIHRNGRTARMKKEGVVYLMQGQGETPSYIEEQPEEQEIPVYEVFPLPSQWATVRVNVGKKSKVNKIDIVGLFTHKGQLAKDDIGKIDVMDFSAYIAVKRSQAQRIVNTLEGEKIKGNKIKLSIAQQKS